MIFTSGCLKTPSIVGAGVSFIIMNRDSFTIVKTTPGVYSRMMIPNDIAFTGSTLSTSLRWEMGSFLGGNGVHLAWNGHKPFIYLSVLKLIMLF